MTKLSGLGTPEPRWRCWGWAKAGALTATPSITTETSVLFICVPSGCGSIEVATKVSGRDAGHFTKRGGERTGLAEADLEANGRHRQVGACQQRLGAFHASSHMIAVRRHPERLLEGAGEMAGAQACQSGELAQRDIPGDVRLDVFGKASLLPASKPAARCLPQGSVVAIEPHELMGQYHAQGVHVAALGQLGIFRLCLELARGLPQVLVQEEEARLEFGCGK